MKMIAVAIMAFAAIAIGNTAHAGQQPSEQTVENTRETIAKYSELTDTYARLAFPLKPDRPVWGSLDDMAGRPINLWKTIFNDLPVAVALQAFIVKSIGETMGYDKLMPRLSQSQIQKSVAAYDEIIKTMECFGPRTKHESTKYLLHRAYELDLNGDTLSREHHDGYDPDLYSLMVISPRMERVHAAMVAPSIELLKSNPAGIAPTADLVLFCQKMLGMTPAQALKAFYR